MKLELVELKAKAEMKSRELRASAGEFPSEAALHFGVSIAFFSDA